MEADVQRSYPLAFHPNGDPATVPAEASFFRLKVARGTAKKPKLVRDSNGAPLLLPLETRPEEFQAMLGPGRYRLEPVDENGVGLQSQPYAYVIDREEEEDDDDPNASRAEVFVAKLLKEQRQLLTRVLDMAEKQLADRAEEVERRVAERAAELERQAAERTAALEVQARLLTAHAERHEKAMTTLATQNAQVVSTLTGKYGSFLAESTKLLSAHPAASAPPSALQVVSEHQAVRNAVQGLAEQVVGIDSDALDAAAAGSPLLSIVDKSLDVALPILTPVIQRGVQKLFASSQAASSPSITTSIKEPRAAAPKAAEDVSDADFAHVNAIMEKLSALEKVQAMAAQSSMTDVERDTLRAELLALSPDLAVARIREILASKKSAAEVTR